MESIDDRIAEAIRLKAQVLRVASTSSHPAYVMFAMAYKRVPADRRPEIGNLRCIYEHGHQIGFEAI
jgi:hypothetical protein